MPKGQGRRSKRGAPATPTATSSSFQDGTPSIKLPEEPLPVPSPADRFFEWLERTSLQGWALPLVVMFGLFVRWVVALNNYSGYNTPPMYGDYEAQRHWMEITLHLPVNKWYAYDLEWWGLDYPPLTAYVSRLCGFIGSAINPEWFALDTSRGYESPEIKVFMRATVLVLDYLIYVPAVLVFVNWWFDDSNAKKKFLAALCILCQPGLILIDHGHFQYNSVMLGLTVWALNFYRYDRDFLGSVFFCCALNFKQMSLYYALPIFAYLLGKCLREKVEGLLLFLGLCMTVIITFHVTYMPFLGSMGTIMQVFHRLFPLERGLYEDKVANVWCAMNVVVKLRDMLDTQVLVKISLVATLLATAPSSVLICRSPKMHTLVYALANSALSFFLFSFQVHEKSILLPALPITLLIVDERFWSSWFNNVAMFSMFPLLKKDGLVLPYFVMSILWNWLGSFVVQRQSTSPDPIRHLSWASYAAMLALHLLEFTVPPPKRYPDLYVVLNAVLSAGAFLLFWLYFNYRQYVLQQLPQAGRAKVE